MATRDSAQYWTVGVFDSVTRGVVLACENANGLKDDGIVGHQTWAARQAEEPVPGPATTDARSVELTDAVGSGEGKGYSFDV